MIRVTWLHTANLRPEQTSKLCKGPLSDFRPPGGAEDRRSEQRAARRICGRGVTDLGQRAAMRVL